VLQVRAYGSEAQMARVAERLAALPDARHVLHTADSAADRAMVTADVGAAAADAALQAVLALGVPRADVELLRIDTVGPATSEAPLGNVVWADLLGQAGSNARLLGRYLVFMAIAGIIASFGVVYANGILIVGAMAVSPDILPVTATCTGIVLRRPLLARRGIATLLVGLLLAGIVAALMTGLLDVLDLIPQNFTVDSNALQGLDTVDASTVIVALAAGVAAILSLETRATFAVGVAISITTIPATAYLGVAAGVGHAGDAGGALAVLVVNIVMLIVGGSLTLLVQRRLGRRRGRRPHGER
jgi:uncharacterized hydrophobic protein (TIGR00271 family)